MSTTENSKSAEVVREEIDKHIAAAGAAIDPYILEAGQSASWLKHQSDDLVSHMGLPRELVEAMGLDDEKLREGIEQGVVPSAIILLMVDIAHFCQSRGFRIESLTEQARKRFNEEVDMASDSLLYGRDVAPNFFRHPQDEPSAE